MSAVRRDLIEPPSFDIFVSHKSTADKDVERIAKWIHSHSKGRRQYQCWTDDDKITPSSRVHDEISDGLSRSSLMLALVTADFGKSQEIRAELTRGSEREIPVIVIAKSDEPLPDIPALATGAERLNLADFVSEVNDEAGVDLLDRLDRLVAKPGFRERDLARRHLQRIRECLFDTLDWRTSSSRKSGGARIPAHRADIINQFIDSLCLQLEQVRLGKSTLDLSLDRNFLIRTAAFANKANRIYATSQSDLLKFWSESQDPETMRLADDYLLNQTPIPGQKEIYRLFVFRDIRDAYLHYNVLKTHVDLYGRSPFGRVSFCSLRTYRDFVDSLAPHEDHAEDQVHPDLMLIRFDGQSDGPSESLPDSADEVAPRSYGAAANGRNTLWVELNISRTRLQVREVRDGDEEATFEYDRLTSQLDGTAKKPTPGFYEIKPDHVENPEAWKSHLESLVDDGQFPALPIISHFFFMNPKAEAEIRANNPNRVATSALDADQIDAVDETDINEDDDIQWLSWLKWQLLRKIGPRNRPDHVWIGKHVAAEETELAASTRDLAPRKPVTSAYQYPQRFRYVLQAEFSSSLRIRRFYEDPNLSVIRREIFKHFDASLTDLKKLTQPRDSGTKAMFYQALERHYASSFRRRDYEERADSLVPEMIRPSRTPTNTQPRDTESGRIPGSPLRIAFGYGWTLSARQGTPVAIQATLESHPAAKTWTFVEAPDVDATAEQIRKHVSQADCIIEFFSQQTLSDNLVQDELIRASERGVTIIPIRRDGEEITSYPTAIVSTVADLSWIKVAIRGSGLQLDASEAEKLLDRLEPILTGRAADVGRRNRRLMDSIDALRDAAGNRPYIDSIVEQLLANAARDIASLAHRDYARDLGLTHAYLRRADEFFRLCQSAVVINSDRTSVFWTDPRSEKIIEQFLETQSSKPVSRMFVFRDAASAHRHHDVLKRHFSAYAGDSKAGRVMFCSERTFRTISELKFGDGDEMRSVGIMTMPSGSETEGLANQAFVCSELYNEKITFTDIQLADDRIRKDQCSSVLEWFERVSRLAPAMNVIDVDGRFIGVWDSQLDSVAAWTGVLEKLFEGRVEDQPEYLTLMTIRASEERKEPIAMNFRALNEKLPADTENMARRNGRFVRLWTGRPLADDVGIVDPETHGVINFGSVADHEWMASAWSEGPTELATLAKVLGSSLKYGAPIATTLYDESANQAIDADIVMLLKGRKDLFDPLLRQLAERYLRWGHYCEIDRLSGLTSTIDAPPDAKKLPNSVDASGSKS